MQQGGSCTVAMESPQLTIEMQAASVQPDPPPASPAHTFAFLIAILNLVIFQHVWKVHTSSNGIILLQN